MSAKTASSVFDKVPKDISPLDRAQALLLAAASIGFKYDNPEQALTRFIEEVQELRDTPNQDETGDVLHAAMSLIITITQSEGFEHALLHANRKFEARFRLAEKLAQDDKPENLKGWLKLWSQAKQTLEPR